MSAPSPSSASGLGFAFLGFAFFATHDAITKHLGDTYSVLQIIFFAMLFAFVPLSLTMMSDKAVDNFRPRHPWLLLLRSAFNLTALTCGFYAFTVLPMAEVFTLLFASPILITVFSIPFLGEKVGVQRWVAVIVGLVGVLVVLRPGVTEMTWGHIAALVSACSNAMGSIVVRKIGAKERTAVFILYSMTLALVVMAFTLPTVYIPVKLSDMALMATVGFLSISAELCVIRGFKSAPAAVIAPTHYSQMIWAIIFGYFFFNETPDAFVAVGAVIIIGSGLFIVWRESRENVSASNPVLKNRLARFALAPIFTRRSNKPE